MIAVLDAFALSFDSIELSAARAPSAAAIEHAIAAAAPPAPTEPGFYLRDDAGGRFQVDQETGFVTIADPALLEREANAIHRVRLLVIERSGLSYELDMNLRLTGPVPQLVGAEEMAFAIEAPAKPRRRIALAAAPADSAPEPATPWESFSAAHTTATPTMLSAEDLPFGALIAPAPISQRDAHAELAIGDIPPPAGANADWSL